MMNCGLEAENGSSGYTKDVMDLKWLGGPMGSVNNENMGAGEHNQRERSECQCIRYLTSSH